jgi:ankyrin repeat protein
VTAEELLSAIASGDLPLARRLAQAHPELAQAGVACAAALGDADALSAALAADATPAVTVDERGWTPLLYACAGPLPAADCVALLLDHGADPNTYMLHDAGDPDSRIPALYFACVADQPAIVRLLLERGADPNDGESVYHAAELNHTECLELLLANGADISNAHSVHGNTPLYFLTGYATAAVLEGMRWLLEHGADPNVPSRSSELPDGRTPYALAVRSGNQPVAELLLRHGADPSALAPADAFVGACLRADEAAARDLLAQDPRLAGELGVEAPGGGGTPLHHAAWHGRVSAVRLLLDLGAPLDVRDTEFGVSALGWAAHGSANCRSADDDYCQVVDALLAAGASRDAAIDQRGVPPESLASPRVAMHLRER